MSECLKKKEAQYDSKGWGQYGRKLAMTECSREYNRMYGIGDKDFLPSTIPMDSYPQTGDSSDWEDVAGWEEPPPGLVPDEAVEWFERKLHIVALDPTDPDILSGKGGYFLQISEPSSLATIRAYSSKRDAEKIAAWVKKRSPAVKIIIQDARSGRQFMPQTELRDKVREIWVKATEWEGIPPDSKFVVFSEKNPYNKEYLEAVGKLMRAMQVSRGEYQMDNLPLSRYSMCPDVIFEYLLPATVQEMPIEFFKVKPFVDPHSMTQQTDLIDVWNGLALTYKTFPFNALRGVGFIQSRLHVGSKQAVESFLALLDKGIIYKVAAPAEQEAGERMPATIPVGEGLPAMLRSIFVGTHKDINELNLRRVYGDEIFDQALNQGLMAGELARTASKRLMYVTPKGRDYLKDASQGKKYVLFTTGMQAGSTVEVSAWEKEKQGYMQRGEPVPMVKYLPETHEPGRSWDFAQRLQGELTKEFKNPTLTNEKIRTAHDLSMSVNEEKFAQAAYKDRGSAALRAGDTKTAALYDEVGGDEHHHEGQFTDRFKEVGGDKMKFIGDTAEYVAQTIDDTGWREKIDEAFQAAIERTHK